MLTKEQIDHITQLKEICCNVVYDRGQWHGSDYYDEYDEYTKEVEDEYDRANAAFEDYLNSLLAP